MESKHKIKRILLGILTLVFSSVLTVSCNKSNDNTPKINPKYILSGDKVDTYEIYDYYDIGNDELAISLKEELKTTQSQIGTIPSSHTYTENGVQVTKPVTGIWHNAFHGCPATSITLTNNITVIDFEAFMACNIHSIEIPYSIDEIGDAAFYSCENLNSVKFVNSNQESSSSACSCQDQQQNQQQQQQQNTPAVYSSITLIPSFCFFNCNALKDIALPASITEIGEEAFNGCSTLESDLFFQSIQIIRARAFQGCYALRTVYISKSLFESANNIGIEPHAFNFCHDNLDIVFCGTAANVNAWIANHPIWGWKNDLGDPDNASNRFTARIDTSESYFSTEWTYTYAIRDGVPEVTITKYNGPAPTDGFISIPDTMPFPEGNKVVRIAKAVFSDDIKLSLERIYLPTTLLAIESLMFRKDYDNLYVVADNTQCSIDKALADNNQKSQIVGRIDLSGITDLEFIGMRAFAGIGTHFNSYKATSGYYTINYTQVANVNIKKVHLPAKIRAIGNEAFGIFAKRMFPNVTEFLWDYDDTYSCLEIIGSDAFYGLGFQEGVNLTDETQITGNAAWREHTASTIIFPRTLKRFGFISEDYTRYNTAEAGRTNLFDFRDDTIQKEERSGKQDRPSHAFVGCSLLGKVIFKGGAENETYDLIVPLQTFVYNESLHTIVFEERENHYITFHTQCGDSDNYHYCQEAIGGNAGRGKNDFRGEPFLHTLVLPNKNTYLRIQNFAFHGNSRAAIYLSDTLGHNMYYDNKNGVWKKMSFETKAFFDNSGNEVPINWRTIGDENWYSANGKAKGDQAYYGYCFSTAEKTNKTGDNSLNTFSLDQKTPVYENVHYYEKINDPNDATTTDTTTTCSNLTVEVGENNPKEYVEQDKCSYVLESKTVAQTTTYIATMTNYLYNLYDGSADMTKVKVAESITSSYSGASHSYTVKKIGDSAFSACFCDSYKKDNATAAKTPGNFDDLNEVILPNTIEEIGEYAFIRAYGVQKISSYTGNGNATEGMPSSLRYIGKNAFTFCGIKKVLKIPYECKFYENYENVADTHKTTSIFSNSLDLRLITFLASDNSTEGDSSYYYSTTQYTSTIGSATCTCALYSNNVTTDPNGNAIKDNNGNNTTWHNGNRLLLVLNREYQDNVSTCTSADTTANSGNTGLVFDGKYKHDQQGNGIPFLFGAFKMGYWITELITGTSTQDGSGNTYAQALFSAVGKRGSANSTLSFTDRYIYMGSANKTYDATGNDNTYSNLTTITGSVLKLPRYGTNGCERLNSITFPVETDASIPEGLFANNSSTTTNYKTTEAVATHRDDLGYLDLRGTGYSSIGKDAFKNNSSIVHFIAPNVSNFTIGESAFESCTKLQEIDLSAITSGGTITISKNAFKTNTALTTITFPSDVTVKIEAEGIFSGCTSLQSVVLPTGLNNKIGPSVFSGCNNLESVTCTGNLSINKIDSYAFSGCSKLDTFDFDKMPNVSIIQKEAFKGAGKLVNVGETNVTKLPAALDKIYESAFNGSGIVNLVIQSSTLSLIEANAFASCTSLQTVRFTTHNCTWTSYNAGIFNSCTNLVELQLPSGYNIGNTGSSIMSGDSSIKIYSYTKYTGASAKETWRTTSTGVSKTIYYYVSSIQDLIDGGVITNAPSVVNTTTEFWFADASGASIYLGTVTTYDGTTVTFSTGYTYDATNGFVAH